MTRRLSVELVLQFFSHQSATIWHSECISLQEVSIHSVNRVGEFRSRQTNYPIVDSKSI